MSNSGIQTMAPVSRQTKINFLVGRKFPGISLAPTPFATPSVSLSGERLRRKDPEARDAAFAYRTQLSAIPADELDALFIAELTKRGEEERAQAEFAEQERFFNQPDATADCDHWSRAAYWTLEEAMALSFGRAPEIVTWDEVKGYAPHSPFARQYARRRDLALRARQMQQLTDPVLPGVFLAWAKRSDVPVFEGLEAAVKRRGVQVADWKTLYDDLKAKSDEEHKKYLEILDAKDHEIARLTDRIDEVQSRIASVAAPSQSGAVEKPLGARERDSLLKLIIGMAVKAYVYDPKARSNVPKEIADDLAELGIALDEDTVRKWLKAAAELLPTNPGEPEQGLS